jgi:hypothetical protein
MTFPVAGFFVIDWRTGGGAQAPSEIDDLHADFTGAGSFRGFPKQQKLCF